MRWSGCRSQDVLLWSQPSWTKCSDDLYFPNKDIIQYVRNVHVSPHVEVRRGSSLAVGSRWPFTTLQTGVKAIKVKVVFVNGLPAFTNRSRRSRYLPSEFMPVTRYRFTPGIICLLYHSFHCQRGLKPVQTLCTAARSRGEYI